MVKATGGMMQGTRVWQRNRAILVLVLVLCAAGAFLRFYRLDELMVFAGDQGRDVTIIQRMIETGQPVLLGPGSGAGQFKRGPAYYYLLLPALWVSGGEPFGGMMLIVFVNIAAIVLVYLVGRVLVSQRAGLVTAALFAVGLVPVVITRAYTNPALVPGLTLLMVYALWRMVEGDDRYLPVLVGAWLVAWQLHDQVWLLLPFVLIVWIFFHIRVRWRMLGFALAVAFVLLAPFLYYEATHGAVNSLAMLDYVRSAGAERAGQVGLGGAPQRVVETLRVLVRAFADPMILRVLWSASALASGLVLLMRFRKESRGAQLLGLYALVPFFFAFWPGPIYEVNVAIVVPVPFLLCGYGFERLTQWQPRRQTIGAVIVGFLCVINFLLQFDSLRTRSPGADSYLTVKQAVAAILERAAGQPFVFEYIVKTRTEEFASPFQYLLKRDRAAVTTDWMAPRLRVYNPALLAEPGYGTRLHGLQIVATAPPKPVSDNLLSKPWNLSRGAEQSALNVFSGQIDLQSESLTDTPTAVQRAPIEPNTLYLVQFECRNALTQGDQRVYVSALDSQSKTLEIYPTGAGYICPPSADWSRGAVLFQSSAETVRARIMLQNRGVGIVRFRNVQLRRVELELLP